MASILTNNGAMVALQTMRNINKGMESTQSQIATGMKVATAKDNASTWAIASVMRSDVAGFKAISSTLATANATVGVARAASESITDLLKTVKEKVTEAQSESADRTKIQADITQLSEQIQSIVGSAQFNGVNLLGADSTLDVLMSLDREGSAVSASSLTVDGQNLSVNDLKRVTDETALNDMIEWNDGADTDPEAVTSIGANGGAATLVLGTLGAGDRLEVTIGNTTRSFTVGATPAADPANPPVAETAESVAARIAGAFAGGALVAEVTDNSIVFTNNGSEALALGRAAFEEGGDVTVGLGGLSTLDVSAPGGAAAALAAIDGLIDTAVNAAASFGTAQNRIEAQQKFMSTLTDAMNTGIGALVDADMEEASARLQALQVQQQLGIQALSIANQQPQNVLALFR